MIRIWKKTCPKIKVDDKFNLPFAFFCPDPKRVYVWLHYDHMSHVSINIH